MPGIVLITSSILTHLILIIACQNSCQNLLNLLAFGYFDKYNYRFAVVVVELSTFFTEWQYLLQIHKFLYLSWSWYIISENDEIPKQKLRSIMVWFHHPAQVFKYSVSVLLLNNIKNIYQHVFHGMTCMGEMLFYLCTSN